MKSKLQRLLLNNEWSGEIYINGRVEPGHGTVELSNKTTEVNIGQTGIASNEDI